MTWVKKISIISTEQNYKWLSMQEVLPSIAKCWEDACISLGIESKTVNADITPLRDFAPFLIQSDLIIIIAFNETIAKVMRHIRLNLQIDAPFILHLYGHGTLGLWPQARFGALEVMNAGDSFIGTCPGDIACMKITSSNAKTFDIPYPYFPIGKSISSILGEEGVYTKKIVFAYIGRISDQKNIDLLIEAYHLLALKMKDAPILIIYGKEDFLGSPNMGIKSSNCLERVVSLIKEYKLENKIVLRGFVEREEIYRELGSQHIFVSTSTHSDENFGMALMRSLAIGAMAVVSDWGGHKVFKKHSPQSVKLAPVTFKNFHPVIDPVEFATLMEEALNENNHELPKILSNYFSSTNVIKKFEEIINNYEFSDKKLEISDIAKKLHLQQLEYEYLGDIQKAFSSYEDPIAQLFLKAYAK